MDRTNKIRHFTLSQNMYPFTSAILLNSVDSTHAFCQRQPAAEHRIVWTRSQSSGRGQGNNVWHDYGKANIFLTVEIHKPILSCEVSALSLCVASALRLALQKFMHHENEIKIKWPNDLVVIKSDNSLAKLGGILLQSQYLTDQISHLRVGIGLNVAKTTNQNSLSNENKNEMNSLHFQPFFLRERVFSSVSQSVSKGSVLRALIEALRDIFFSVPNPSGRQQHPLGTELGFQRGQSSAFSGDRAQLSAGTEITARWMEEVNAHLLWKGELVQILPSMEIARIQGVDMDGGLVIFGNEGLTEKADNAKCRKIFQGSLRLVEGNDGIRI